MDPHAVKVVKRLNSHGHMAYLVGGCVRDLLLGYVPKDFDVATDASPEQVRKIFRNSRLIGRRFRLAHVVFGADKIIEVATFRRQAEIEDRDLLAEDEAEDLLIRHDNSYGEPHEDALRRDFTINGLFYDVERQEVIDYVNGYEDIETSAIRTIGVADVRFREDPVRMLRAIKFSSRLGLPIAPEVYQAILDVGHELMRAAKPRVFEEILRLLRSGKAYTAVALLWDAGLLKILLPEIAVYAGEPKEAHEGMWQRLKAMDAHVQKAGAVDDAVLLAVLFYDAVTDALHGAEDRLAAFDSFIEPINRRFTIPRRLRERMLAIIIAQKRILRGKAHTLSHRSYYRVALDFCAIQQQQKKRV